MINPLDLDSYFLRMLTLSQQRDISVSSLFEYEMCTVPPSLFDEYGCLRKGTKASLVKKLGEVLSQPRKPEAVIVDAQQLIYHVTWPLQGTAVQLASSMEHRIQKYDCAKVVVFDKYQELSAKDHERIRRGGVGSKSYNIDLNTPLPKREVIMRNNHNKINLSKVLSMCHLGQNVTIENKYDEKYKHDEADITMLSYVLEACQNEAKTVRVLSDDTDVFVLLVYWVHAANINAQVQMEKWDGKILHINKTCDSLGSKSLQLLPMHYITGSDCTSYPYRKGKAIALGTLKANDCSVLNSVLGDINATDDKLLSVGRMFFSYLYGQKLSGPMAKVRFKIYNSKKGKALDLKTLPPTDKNVLLHMKRVNLQVILCKAANQTGPPQLSITDFGWEVVDGVPCPVYDKGLVGPPDVLSVISCSCKAEGTACSSARCSCRKGSMPCAAYCNCDGGEDCFNPYKVEAQCDDEESEDDSDGESEL